MSNQGSSVTDLLNSLGLSGASPGGQSTGSQAQFNIYLQLIQRIVAVLEDNASVSTNPFTVYPITGSYNVNIASDFPAAMGGIIVIRNASPGATTVTLPTTGGPWFVADGAGNASSFPITVNTTGGITIAGAATYILAFNWQEAGFILDTGANNYIVGI